jgi:four helix bundle protein
MYARKFTDLVVYKLAKSVARKVFVVTASFPLEEKYSLTDQVRRASRSIGAQIAEAWAKRRYEKHFVSKLTDADGEQLETQHWIGEALDCAYLDEVTAKDILSDLESIGRMLNQMILKADLFCQEDARCVREGPGRYGLTGEFYIPSSAADPAPVTGHRSLVTGVPA